jgi:peptidoglycan hydrolase-like protein with peptidoglycan-binding domain
VDAESQSRQKPPKSLVFHVQVLLKQRGYDPGPIDGIIGTKTKQSIQAFQFAAKFPPSGLITTDLLQRLEADDDNEREVSVKP